MTRVTDTFSHLSLVSLNTLDSSLFSGYLQTSLFCFLTRVVVIPSSFSSQVSVLNTKVVPGPSNKGCTILRAGVTPWSRDRIRHEPDVCQVYPLVTIGALWFTRYYTSIE
ncbi:hypothetical protein J6590_083613 [Homalodisca vitripennis]|nr:hypothetical protein J6590_083613 [Homalodisca vitripennis]